MKIPLAALFCFYLWSEHSFGINNKIAAVLKGNFTPGKI